MACARGLQILDHEGPETETETYDKVDYVDYPTDSFSIPTYLYLSTLAARAAGV